MPSPVFFYFFIFWRERFICICEFLHVNLNMKQEQTERSNLEYMTTFQFYLHPHLLVKYLQVYLGQVLERQEEQLTFSVCKSKSFFRSV